ncbi:thioredoxin fold domain-containing protein [Marinomonas sp.]|nr:thioredoxin fold domain-containing protein [Marinomonas sp.]MDB4837872.1 thioredoxin fold domain-containing protein [Marinomonas sp.]
MKRNILSLPHYVLSIAILLLFSTRLFADQSVVVSAINAALPQFEIESIQPHENTSLYIVDLKQGPMLYVTEDGKYFVAGDLYRIEDEGLVNETELVKLAKVEALPESDMVVFKADNEKAHVSVFTDVDCIYCRMLHNEVSKLNAAGISVRYLAYPRAGIDSGSYLKMVSIWCSSDPHTWLAKAKSGDAVPENKCINPVAEQFALGQEVGVRGTPSIILPSGELIPGYLTADQLVKRLGL